MCGRYVIVTQVEEIEVRFYVQTGELREYNLTKGGFVNINYNLGPGMAAPVIGSDKPKQIQIMHFGLTPAWSKKRMYLFNARTEGDRNAENNPNYSGAKDIINKPSFRQAIRKRRCLIPCNGFIEGPEKEKLSKPYYVFMRDRRPFALAGIWEDWADPETGEVTRGFAIITTVANPLLQKIGHHRSPVIIAEQFWNIWLNEETPLHDVTMLLEPYDYKEMNAYPIDPKIKSPRATGPELIKPTGNLIFAETDTVYNDKLKLVGMGRGKRDDHNGVQMTLEEIMRDPFKNPANKTPDPK